MNATYFQQKVYISFCAKFSLGVNWRTPGIFNAAGAAVSNGNVLTINAISQIPPANDKPHAYRSLAIEVLVRLKESGL
jgi:hypothetical protein